MLAVIGVAAVTAILPAASSRAGVASHRVSPALGGFSATPMVSAPQQQKSTIPTFDCQSYPLDGSLGPRCYTPQQIQQAYGYSGLLASGVNGKGETIVIVDAFSNPYLAKDLKIQDATFKLPDPNFKVVAPQGVPAFDINNGDMDNWAVEMTLDVLWAHAMAPGASIVLVEAKSDQDSDMLAATKWAVDNNAGDVISQSFGEAETCADSSFLAQEHAVFQEAVNKGITLFASSGDSGAAQYNCDGSAAILSVGSPASDPLVTSVGGTTLDASNPAGNYLGETAWTEPYLCNPPDADDVNCSGGGYSTLYSVPDFQQGVVAAGSGRGVPDVSYNAGLNGGVLIHSGLVNLFYGYAPNDPTVFFTIGGTSAGSPQWAALAADAGQLAGHPLGDINPTLYALASRPATYAADFHDITVGSNTVADLGGEGYDTGTGWDAVTGLGTPNAANLLPALAAGCVSGTVTGDLTVGSGQTLCLLPGAHVTHDLVVQKGGTLIDEGATIDHDLHADGAASVSVTGGSVGHDLVVQNSTGGVTITGVTVGHDLNVLNNAGPTVISGNSAAHDANCQKNGGQTGSGNGSGHSNSCPI
ncbi:MAG TPA: S53 family peptidase [Gaiellaceae bacterium]|nr:S53 family peptidase [Gaiellaceae bacterium]